MKIIRSIRIRYFRSVYITSLSHVGGLNIISGRNDVGKSNILRALNLFFNGETDWHTSIAFYEDFSIDRLEQVRKESVKGRQFISIEVEFTRPSNYSGSLPPTFSVTRTWYRAERTYVESNNLDALNRQSKLPSNIKTARRFLSVFLNRVHYEYIPAVKDRAYIDHLLGRLQATVLAVPLGDTGEMSELASNLAGHIEGQIGQLKVDFERATGLTTSIEPPQELAALFQAFHVSTTTVAGKVPLVLRGDGLQARYVPSVLHYIASNSNDFFIWGFEEPENSLEYRHVTRLAADFEGQYSKDAQLFVTSHSPAFVSLSGSHTVCYRALQNNARTEIVRVDDDTSQFDALRAEIGFLELQKEVHNTYERRLAELDFLKTQVDTLKNELGTYEAPLLLVEGITDKLIIECAWTKLRGTPMPFLLRVAEVVDGQGAGARQVAAMVAAIHPEEGRPVIGLLDHDREGKTSFNGLPGQFRSFPDVDVAKRHRNGLAYALLLPVPDFRTTEAQVGTLCIEKLFSDEVLRRRTAAGHGLTMKPPQVTSIQMGNLALLPELLDKIAPTKEDLAPYETIGDGKRTFAEEIVPDLPKSDFTGFVPLFDVLGTILDMSAA